MRRHASIMGMPVSLDIPGYEDEKVFKEIFKELEAVDNQFSLFKNTSELSRFNHRELKPEQLSVGMKQVMLECLKAEKMTDGYFSARYGGGFDPSGYVKGWAIASASQSLKNKGFQTFCLSAGGDVNALSDSDKVWHIGIADPREKDKIIGKITAKNIAVATSGSSERGDHIINPKTGQPARELLSITVAGADITTADILATAAFAMGRPGLDFIDKQPGYEVLAVDNVERVLLSGGMKDMLVTAHS
jgi:FAD:protein FMN transferase